MEDVLPEILSNYNETTRRLDTLKKNRELDYQLRETLVGTSQLVMRNHRKEYCLKSRSISSVVPVYPLLLHEATEWHARAMTKFKVGAFEPSCWDVDRHNPCFRRISFNLPFAISLWEPMIHLLQEFDANCRVSAKVLLENARINASDRCVAPAWIMSESRCRDASHCFPKKCSFANYTIDVRSFFRHVNESQKFLGPHDNPLSKKLDRTRSQHEIIRGNLVLNVSKDRPFRVTFDPVREIVKLSFHIEAVRNCSLCKKRLKGKCNETLSVILQLWFSSIHRRLKFTRKRQRNCANEVNKANPFYWQSGDFGSRKKRSGYYSDRTRNALPRIPKHCVFLNVKGHMPTDVVWSQVIKAAVNSGGYIESSNRITFRALGDVMRFLRADQCPSIHVSELSSCFFKKTGKRPKTYLTRVIVSEQTPFMIERSPLLVKFVRFKFFTQRLRSDTKKC